MNTAAASRPTVYVARCFIALAFVALLGAWLTQLIGRPVLGMAQQHLFNDAMTLALLGIALFVDAFWHARHV